MLKFGPLIARRLQRRRPRPRDRWHLDEMVVRIAGKRMYLARRSWLPQNSADDAPNAHGYSLTLCGRELDLNFGFRVVQPLRKLAC